MICLSLSSGFVAPVVAAKGKKPAVKTKAVKPTVTYIEHERLALPAGTKKKTIPLSVEIIGKGFGKTLATESVRVTLINTDSQFETRATVKVATDDKIIAHADAPANEDGSTECRVELEINGKPVDTTGIKPIKEPAGQTSTTKSTTGNKAESFEVEFKAVKTQSPSLHSVAITTKDDVPHFDKDPNLNKVAILPAGATKISIEPGSNPQALFVEFLAPEGFEVKDVLVTVYDSAGNVVGYTKPKTANGEVTIASVDVLSLQRRDGFGRLKIEGSGFGDYEARAGEGELGLLCETRNRTSLVDERLDTKKKEAEVKELCAEYRKAQKTTWRDEVMKKVNVALVPRNPDLRVERTQILYIDDKVIDVYFEFSHFDGYSEPFRLESVTVTVKKTDDASLKLAASKKFQSKPDKNGAGTNGAVTEETAATPNTSRTITYVATHNIGPPKDANLEYRYTVLDKPKASQLFGSGVGENFYVLQLSLLNKGDKKVLIPLSSIQAEIEWAYQADCGDDQDSTKSAGNSRKKPKDSKMTPTDPTPSESDDLPRPCKAKVFYDEGPATVSPLALSAISGYFDIYQKSKGKSARFFNILDGLVTLGGTMVPVFGRNIERPVAIMSSGLIPGLHRAIGDLSGEQLQNLTSLSWDSVEEVPANGGKEKFIYIQRADESYSGSQTEKSGNKGETIKRRIKSIGGLEVSGFIVKDSSAATAVKQP